MQGDRVLVVGAGVAGLATAYWLRRYGMVSTVVERAEGLRGGGHDVDLRGPALRIVEDMGVLDALRALQTPRRETVVLDRDGEPASVLPPEVFSGELEIDQTDLVTELARLLDPGDVAFGDTVTALDETGDGVRVTYARAEPATVDVVVGADGVHSAVRRLVFGPEDAVAHPLGLLAAGFHTASTLPRADRNWFYQLDGASAGVACRADRDTMHVVLCVAADDAPRDLDARRETIAAGLHGAGWQVPALVDALRATPDPYCDVMTLIRMPAWSRGRVVLVGDAAGCAAPTSGRGTSQALLGARVLAAELAGHRDHRAAFSSYEDRLRPTVEHHQSLGAAAARWFLGDGAPGSTGPEPPPIELPPLPAG